MKNKVKSLVKINLKLCNLPVKVGISSLVFFIAVYMISSRLAAISRSYHINLNIWDGILKTVNYSSFILGFYLPFVVVITTFFNVKNDYEKCIMLRSSHKRTYIVSKSVTNSILAFLFTSLFFVILFIINMFMFKYETWWSDFVLNKENVREVINTLYVNSFVYNLNPIEAVLISYIEIFISSLILFSLRDLLMNYIQRKYIVYTIISSYLIGNVIFDGFSLEGGLCEAYKYIGLDTMALLYKHNFSQSNYFPVPLWMSLIFSFALLAVIISINLLLNRRLVISHD